MTRVEFNPAVKLGCEKHWRIYDLMIQMKVARTAVVFYTGYHEISCIAFETLDQAIQFKLSL